MEILSEFFVQIVKVVFFIAIIVLAVKLGAHMRKNKNLKDNEIKDIKME